MKGVFVLFGKSAEQDRSGIGLKVRNQIKIFNEAGLNCEQLVLPITNSGLMSVMYRLPFFNVYPVWKYMDEFDMVDYLYMRRPFVMNYHMRRVLKKIREKNPSVKIIVEIPTYPYDDEYGSYKAKWLLIAKDKYNRNKMNGIIDRFAILTDEKEIFAVETIKISNGIDVNGIKPRIPVVKEDNTIHVCAVAMFKEWHGYERIIEGIKLYYNSGGQRKFIFHFVGEGSELPIYINMVKDYSLEDYFVFHGFLEGNQLEEIYNLCSLSIGTFGMYKKNIHLSCDLKSREAVARGLPMITGCQTDIFIEGEYKYYLEFPNDSSIIDIQKIVDFYDNIYDKPEIEIVNEIREYAYKKISMEKCMGNVIDYLKS